MKTTSFLIAFLAIFSIFINSLFCSSAEAAGPVLDSDGDNLIAGAYYYLLPAFRGKGYGGGVLPGSIGNETSCPLAVFQDPLDIALGLPLVFTPENPEEGVIRLSTDLNIKFPVPSICPQSTVWKVDKYDESVGRSFITTGGVKGNPGPATISNWFKIEKSSFLGYKLVHCPTVCKFCKVICKDVGIFLQDGYRRLALSGSPFDVQFWKAAQPRRIVYPNNGVAE